MKPKRSEKVKMWPQGLKRGPGAFQEGVPPRSVTPGFGKKVIFWAPLGEPELFRGTQKSNFGVQGSKNTAKIQTIFHDVFEVAHKSGKVDKTM